MAWIIHSMDEWQRLLEQHKQTLDSIQKEAANETEKARLHDSEVSNKEYDYKRQIKDQEEQIQNLRKTESILREDIERRRVHLASTEKQWSDKCKGVEAEGDKRLTAMTQTMEQHKIRADALYSSCDLLSKEKAKLQKKLERKR